jgi:nucleoid-associated protein YgaU
LKSPDRTRSHTVRGGETLSAIATEEWERPEEWRRIADENAIEDPRRLRPGAFLDIPVISPR